MIPAAALLLALLVALPALAGTGPARPNVARADIRGLRLGESPQQALPRLKTLSDGHVTTTNTLCEAERLAQIARSGGVNGAPTNSGKCIYSLSANISSEKSILVLFTERLDVTPHVSAATQIEYDFHTNTDADYSAAYKAVISKYGTPTFYPSEFLSLWLPFQCGARDFPDGGRYDPCWRYERLTALELDHNFVGDDILKLTDGTLIWKNSTLAQKAESAVRTGKVPF